MFSLRSVDGRPVSHDEEVHDGLRLQCVHAPDCNHFSAIGHTPSCRQSWMWRIKDGRLETKNWFLSIVYPKSTDPQPSFPSFCCLWDYLDFIRSVNHSLPVSSQIACLLGKSSSSSIIWTVKHNHLVLDFVPALVIWILTTDLVFVMVYNILNVREKILN